MSTVGILYENTGALKPLVFFSYLFWNMLVAKIVLHEVARNSPLMDLVGLLTYLQDPESLVQNRLGVCEIVSNG